jgi:hypothetical protein
MTKISMDMAHRIAVALVDRTHGPEQAGARAAYQAAVAAAYAAVMTPEVARAIVAIPTAFLYPYGSARVTPDDGSANVHCVHPGEGAQGWHGVRLIPAHLYSAVTAARARQISAAEARGKAVDQVAATVRAYGTVKRLFAGWPEVEPVVRPLLDGGAGPKPLPLVPIAQLNKLCGLPVEGGST